MTTPQITRVLILGAGTGGIAVAARLRRTIPAKEITLVDPAEFHYYQPMWTLVGAGVTDVSATRKPLPSVVPPGVRLIRDSIKEINPRTKVVVCSSGLEIFYEYLVVASGLKLDWEKISGIENSLRSENVSTIYQPEQAEKTFKLLDQFKGGHAVFTMPPVPIKCAGAPQKIMYLADEIFRRNGVRHKTKITFAVSGKVIFGVPTFAKELLEVAKRKDINLLFSHKLMAVNTDNNCASFEVASDDSPINADGSTLQIVSIPFEYLHVVPPMSPHDVIKDSGLAWTTGPHKGWLKVDPYTLQHQDHSNVFGIGDVTGVANSKTGAAIRKQAPIVANNLIAGMQGKVLTENYDGYSSCPLVTGFGKVILAEFGYDGQLMPTFPLDMTKERRSMWILKRYLLPVLYWFGILKGRM